MSDLKPCPCGKAPKRLPVVCDGRGRYYTFCGECSGWCVKFDTSDGGAREAWNNAPRAEPKPSDRPNDHDVSSVYLSGPMTGIEDFNFPAFHAAAARLRDAGYQVVNPAEVNKETEMPWAECLRSDIAAMMHECSSVAVLPGWKISKGATLEVGIARRLGWPVNTVDELLKERGK